MKEQFFEMGNQAFDNENFEDAIKYYKKSLEIENDNIDVLFNLSLALYELERYDESLDISNKVIELDDFMTYSEFAWFNKGNCFQKLKKYKEAAEEFTKVIEYNTYNSSAYYNRSNAREKLGDAKGAEVDRNLVKFLERSSQLQDLYQSPQANEIEDYNLDKFNHDKSNLLNEIQQNPESYSLYFDLGNAYAKIREYIKAIEYFELAIKYYPDKFYNKAHQNIIAANFDIKQYKEVIELANDYLMNDKNNDSVNDMKYWAEEELQ